MRFSFYILLTWICIGAFAQTVQVEMFGDSISAGFLSDTAVTAAPPLPKISDMITKMTLFAVTHDQKFLQPMEKRDLAWPSVVGRTLLENYSLEPTMENLAFTGASFNDLPTMVSKTKVPGNSRWAFFFIGHNDLCDAEGDEATLTGKLINRFSEALRVWDSEHKGATAYLMPIAPIQNLYPALEGYAWYTGSGKTFKCEDSWQKYFPYCPSHYTKHKLGGLESYLKPRIRSMNEALQDLASEWNRVSKRNRFVYLDVTYPAAKPRYFAVDCFHFSAEAQTELAEKVVPFLF